MSVESTTVVTTVYPLPAGDPVTYPECEIDELDDNGDLRITGTDANRDSDGFEYVIWPHGSFSRAETKREKVSAADPSTTDDSKTVE